MYSVLTIQGMPLPFSCTVRLQGSGEGDLDVSVLGDLYEVNVVDRQCRPIYWTGMWSVGECAESVQHCKIRVFLIWKAPIALIQGTDHSDPSISPVGLQDQSNCCLPSKEPSKEWPFRICHAQTTDRHFPLNIKWI